MEAQITGSNLIEELISNLKKVVKYVRSEIAQGYFEYFHVLRFIIRK